MNNRREFLASAGVAIAGTGLSTVASATEGDRTRGMARDLILLNLRRGGEDRLGVKTDQGILDVPQAAKLLRMSAPATLDDLLQHEDGPRLNALVTAALKTNAARPAFAKEDTTSYGPVVTRPEKIICVGLNYRSHIGQMPVPTAPVLFAKYNNTLNNHGGTIRLPVAVARKFDYETELVVVIGRTAKDVSEADALSYVAGYCTGNDFTARELQLERGGQWLPGKSPDQFAPLGPYMVTADQVDPGNLKIETRVNGELRQSANTSELIFNCQQLISYISRIITMKPGDIIFTGTPGGVIAESPPEKQVWLKAGDQIVSSLEKLGELKFALV